MSTKIPSNITARAISANLEALHCLLNDATTHSVRGYNLIERDGSNEEIAAAVMELGTSLVDAKTLCCAVLVLMPHRLP